MTDLLDVPHTVTVENSQFNAILEQTSSIQFKANDLEIKDYEDTVLAVEIRKEAKELEKTIEEKRVTMVKPMNDMVSAINQKAKEIKEPIQTVINTIDWKVRRKWDIDDEDKIPVIYKTVDSKKVNEAIKNGIRSIDWIKIYQESGF